MTPQHVLAVLRRRWATVIATVVLAMAVAAGASITSTPQYTASSQVFVAAGGNASPGELAQLNIFVQERVRSYAALATTPLVLDTVVDELDLSQSTEQLAQQIEVSTSTDTVLMRVSVTDTDAQTAAAVADAVVNRLSAVVPEVEPAQADGAPAISIVITDPAEVPSEPSSPRLLLNLALAGVAGIAIGVALALLQGSGRRRT